ncbi:2512_t:CDS:2 [Entrophospora sp. SA101]|nr:2512_t:CDS:2 [Entrophospora sp. SA101]
MQNNPGVYAITRHNFKGALVTFFIEIRAYVLTHNQLQKHIIDKGMPHTKKGLNNNKSVLNLVMSPYSNC